LDDLLRIVMVTFNGMKWLPETMAHIPPSVRVVVVDNASRDETVPFLIENFPAVTVLAQSENLGFGRATNVGITYARGMERAVCFC